MQEHIAQTWAERAQAELGAAQRFRVLLSRFEEHSIPNQLMMLVEKAIEDEERHAFLCAKKALDLGHETGFQKPKEEPTRVRSWSKRSSRDILFLDIVLMCCITESLNASLLYSIYSRSGRSNEGKLIHQILKDEVQHAQIGWAMLQYESEQRDVSFVSLYLSEMLDISVRDELFSMPDVALEASCYSLGVMPHCDRMTQFGSTLYEVLCPGFARCSIDTAPMKAWILSKEDKGVERVS